MTVINDINFFYRTRFLWAGGFLGVLQQIFGHLDIYFKWELFEFAGFMRGLGIWAMFILLFIFRKNASPKEQFKDILLFFVGLNVFYYTYITIVYFIQLSKYEMWQRVTNKADVILTALWEGIYDTIWWTVLGTAAAIWGFFTVKFRNSNKIILYYLMLSPLFIVMLWCLIDDSFFTIKYFMQEYRTAHNLPVENGTSYSARINDIITNLIGLIITGNIFIKQRREYLRNK